MKYDLMVRTIEPDGTVYNDKFDRITLAQVFSLLDIAREYCGLKNTKAWIKIAR